MSFGIESECAHSGRPIRLELDSDLKLLSLEPGADPYIFIPGLDLSNIQEDSIIDVFWRRSVFFWSEEQVKAHQKTNSGSKGAYLTLKQSIALTAPAQGALFGFY